MDRPIPRSTVHVLPTISPDNSGVLSSDSTLGKWLASPRETVLAELGFTMELGFGGARAPSAPTPLDTPGHRETRGTHMAQYVRERLAAIGVPLPNGEQKLYTKVLSTRLRDGTASQWQLDGSDAIIELLMGLMRCLEQCVSMAGLFRQNAGAAQAMIVNVQRQCTALEALLGTIGEDHVPAWQRSLIASCVRMEYPLPLATVLTPVGCRIEGDAWAIRVFDLLKELLWGIRQINRIAKAFPNQLRLAGDAVARCVQIMAALAHLGAGDYVQEWQRLYMDRAINAMEDRPVGGWKPFVIPN